MPSLARGGVQVWWADPAWAVAGHLALLAPDERARMERLVHHADRQRLVVGAALARLVLAAHLGRRPDEVELDRTCDGCGGPHGKPRVPEPARWELSVSHAGDRVAVAVGRGSALGVDVERVDEGLEPSASSALVRQSLGEPEQAALEGAPAASRAGWFFTSWTRKEAVLKATGDGLRVPLGDLVVSAADRPPVLERWHGRADVVPRTTLRTLHPGAGYVATLAVLDAVEVDVVELDARDVLAGSAVGQRSSR